MATAIKQARTSRRAIRGALGATESEPMRSFIVEDNGGDFHWTLLDRGGHSLARSPSFVSYQDAESAARVVLAGASSARLEPHPDTDTCSTMSVAATRRQLVTRQTPSGGWTRAGA
jgi:hypothetical protein